MGRRSFHVSFEKFEFRWLRMVFDGGRPFRPRIFPDLTADDEHSN